MVTRSSIVVCDDNDMLRWSLVLHLEQRGYRCVTAADGVQLLELLEGSSPDLVLLDLSMPRMGGLEALGRIRAQGREVPVIVMTGSGDLARSDAQAMGATTTIAKPFATSEVGDLVDHHIELSTK
ncbi:MAG: response regulator [Myxococcota bacterium]